MPIIHGRIEVRITPMDRLVAKVSKKYGLNRQEAWRRAYEMVLANPTLLISE